MALILASAVMATPPAQAREAEGVEFSGELTLVSDYRFRGVSLSGRGPAIQGGIEAEGDGWFAGAWASTAENMDGPGAELDLYVGGRGSLGGIDYTATGYAYVFEGEPIYFEGEIALERDLSFASLELALSYAPPQQSVDENIYLGAGLTVPAGEDVELFARGGAERSYFFGDKLDWEAGARVSRGPVAFSASLVGIDGEFLPPGEKSPVALFAVTAKW